MKTKRVKLNLTVSPEHKAKAQRLAKKLNRSKSNLFEFLIDKACTTVRSKAAKATVRAVKPPNGALR